jgi:predicted glutamine amidotransferase
MHNGHVAGFPKMKRHIREHIHDQFYDNVLGTTDSEHVFALFLTHLARHLVDYELEDLARAMRAAVRKLERWAAARGIEDPSDFNFAVTDGYNVLATRYSSGTDRPPQTLYVARGDRLEIRDGQYHMLQRNNRTNAVIVASEPLTDLRDEWHPVPANHIVSISPELHVKVEPF